MIKIVVNCDTPLFEVVYYQAEFIDSLCNSELSQEVARVGL